jgi:hypothetical protein
MTEVDRVYTLLAKPDLAVLLPAYEIAKEALPAAEGNELLALHEAIADSLSNLLRELGEHGPQQTQRLLGIEISEIDIRTWVEESTASWLEVKRLRDAGVTSGPLITAYMAGRTIPIGSRDWLNRMRLGVAHRQDPAWIKNVVARLKRV